MARFDPGRNASTPGTRSRETPPATRRSLGGNGTVPSGGSEVPQESEAPEASVLANRNVQIVLLTTLASVVAVSGVTPAFPRIVRALGISQQQVGLLVTAFTVPGIFLTPFLGALADRVGRKAVLVPSLSVFAAAGTACAFVRGPFEALLALRVAQGVGGAPIVALCVTILSDLFEAGPRRTAALGYNSAALNLGTAAYPALGGGLAAVAWYWPFALAAAAFPVGLLVLFALDNREPSDEETRSVYSLREVLWQDGEVAGLLAAIAVLFVLLFGSYLTYLPELLEETFQPGAQVIGLVVSCASASTALTATQVERLARYVSKERLVAVSFAVASAALAMLPHLPRLWMVPLGAALFGTGPGVATTAIIALLTERVPAPFRATVLAANSTAIRVGQTAGPLLTGAIIGGLSTASVFYVGAGLGVAAGAAVWVGLAPGEG